jgi:hypothetical protein
MMKVRELIKILENLDPEKTVELFEPYLDDADVFDLVVLSSSYGVYLANKFHQSYAADWLEAEVIQKPKNK